MLRCIRRHAIQLMLVTVLSCTLAYGFMEPRTAPGQFAFHTFYLFPPTRPVFLQVYSRILRWTEGGYLPSGIDSSLALRLWDNTGSREWRGILSFYLAQGPARWGDACGQLDESVKIQLVRYLLKDMSADSLEVQADKLIFIEYLRRDGELYKGTFDGTVWRWDGTQRRALYNSAKIQEARSAFEVWFASSSRWSELRRRNPLEGTSMAIGGIP